MVLETTKGFKSIWNHRFNKLFVEHNREKFPLILKCAQTVFTSSVVVALVGAVHERDQRIGRGSGYQESSSVDLKAERGSLVELSED